jgi:hypothetical protein
LACAYPLTVARHLLVDGGAIPLCLKWQLSAGIRQSFLIMDHCSRYFPASVAENP